MDQERDEPALAAWDWSLAPEDKRNVEAHGAEAEVLILRPLEVERRLADWLRRLDR
jgi:hypothetical protein